MRNWFVAMCIVLVVTGGALAGPGMRKPFYCEDMDRVIAEVNFCKQQLADYRARINPSATIIFTYASTPLNPPYTFVAWWTFCETPSSVDKERTIAIKTLLNVGCAPPKVYHITPDKVVEK